LEQHSALRQVPPQQRLPAPHSESESQVRQWFSTQLPAEHSELEQQSPARQAPSQQTWPPAHSELVVHRGQTSPATQLPAQHLVPSAHSPSPSQARQPVEPQTCPPEHVPGRQEAGATNSCFGESQPTNPAIRIRKSKRAGFIGHLDCGGSHWTDPEPPSVWTAAREASTSLPTKG
jgi:hypothetical protein